MTSDYKPVLWYTCVPNLYCNGFDPHTLKNKKNYQHCSNFPQFQEVFVGFWTNSDIT